METSSETTETSEHTSQETVETLQKSYLFNGQFFSIVHCDRIKLVAQCKNCSKVIRGRKMSTGNFLSHLKVIINTLINTHKYKIESFNNFK